MKNLCLVFLLCWTIWSCSNRSTDNSNTADTAATNDNLTEQIDTFKIQINTNFPFGCVDLKKLKYPKYWAGDLENYGHLTMPQGKKFEGIVQCFAGINFAKTIKSPQFQSLEVLKIGDDFRGANNIDTLLQRSVDSCKYRLPNIGIYECYYFYERYGNLLLLDPKAKNGKLLNIYADDIGGDSCTMLRYFYMDEKGITIYEGSCYDDGCNLDEKYKIIINQEGEVDIYPIQK